MNATNCLFAQNRAVILETYEGYGGTIYNLGDDAPCHLNLRNCTLVNNLATADDNSIVCSSPDDQFPSIVNISNCILWDENYQIVASVDGFDGSITNGETPERTRERQSVWNMGERIKNTARENDGLLLCLARAFHLKNPTPPGAAQATMVWIKLEQVSVY